MPNTHVPSTDAEDRYRLYSYSDRWPQSDQPHHATCSSPGHVTHSSWRWRDTATVCVWQWPGCQARADQTVPRSAVRVACSDHRCAAANHTVSYCAVLCPCCVVLYRTEPCCAVRCCVKTFGWFGAVPIIKRTVPTTTIQSGLGSPVKDRAS